MPNDFEQVCIFFVFLKNMLTNRGMSSRAKTLEDLDILTVTTINTKGPSNTIIPPFYTLTSDGKGATYWSTMSSPNAFVSAFTTLATPAGTYVADASANRFTFREGGGIGFAPLPFPNTVSVYAKAFNKITVPGQTSLTSLSSITMSSMGMVSIQSQKNTLSYSIKYPNFQVSNEALTITNENPTLTFAGVGGILLDLSANSTIEIGISSFTSADYVIMQQTASTLSTSFLSSLKIFTTKEVLSTLQDFSTNMANDNLSSATLYISSIAAFSNEPTLMELFYPENPAPIYGAISTFSTSLSVLLQKETILSTTSIFSQPTYTLNNETFSTFMIDLSNNYSTASTTLFEFNDCVKKIEYLSSFQGIQYGQDICYSSVLSSIGDPMSTFSTTFTSTFISLTKNRNRANIFSTVPYTLYTPFPCTPTALGTGFTIPISTCEVNLSSFLKYIDSNSKIFLSYTPNYSFSNLSNYQINGMTYSANCYPIETALTYDTSTVTTYLDYTVLNTSSIAGAPTNTRGSFTRSYTNPIKLQIDTNYFISNHRRSFVITHTHSNIVFWKNSMAPYNPLGGAVAPYNIYASNCQLGPILLSETYWRNYMPSTNGLFITINNAIL